MGNGSLRLRICKLCKKIGRDKIIIKDDNYLLLEHLHFMHFSVVGHMLQSKSKLLKNFIKAN